MDIEAKLLIYEYIECFNEQYQLLIRRYNRFKELRDCEEELDAETYFDMIIVQLRAMFSDSSGESNGMLSNYTIDNILSLGSDDAKHTIDEMKRKVIIPGAKDCSECLVGWDCSMDIEGCKVKDGCTIMDAINTIANKTICHYQNFHKLDEKRNRFPYKWEKIQILREILYDKREPINIDYVMDTIISVFHDGVCLDNRH